MDDKRIFQGNPDLYTDRLIMRRYRPEDAVELFKIYSKPEVSRFITWETFETQKEIELFIAKTLEMYDNDETGEWAITLKDSGKLIGSCGFEWYDMQHACAQIGFLLDPDYWGKGLMTEALRALLDFGFNRMMLNRIEGFHIVGNEASGRVMEKLSMKLEGVLRQKIFLRDKFHDVKIYAALKSDFNEMLADT